MLLARVFLDGKRLFRTLFYQCFYRLIKLQVSLVIMHGLVDIRHLSCGLHGLQSGARNAVLVELLDRDRVANHLHQPFDQAAANSEPVARVIPGQPVRLLLQLRLGQRLFRFRCATS